MAHWYYLKGDQQIGPVDNRSLTRLAKIGRLLPTDQVWTEGQSDWIQAANIDGLFRSSATKQPAQQTQSAPQDLASAVAACQSRGKLVSASKNPKRRLLVMAVFFGAAVIIAILVWATGRNDRIPESTGASVRASSTQPPAVPRGLKFMITLSEKGSSFSDGVRTYSTGMDAADFIVSFGKPDSYKTTGTTDSPDLIFARDGLIVLVKEAKVACFDFYLAAEDRDFNLEERSIIGFENIFNDALTPLKNAACSVRTDRGIGAGAPRSEIVNSYGDPDETTSFMRSYEDAEQIRYKGATFVLTENKLVEITLISPKTGS